MLRISSHRYRGDRYSKSFSCSDQFLCLAFAQLTYRESLRDIEACLRAQRSKLYHMGFSGHVSHTTLADANEYRDWRIFGDFAQRLIQQLANSIATTHGESISPIPSMPSIPRPSICA